MKITMNDVARESGVSKATVSYVLNNRQSSFGISNRTVTRVLDTVKRLNYKVDPAAVLLSEKKNDIVSILLLSPWLHAQFSSFMVQVSSAVEEMSRNYKLKISYEMYREGELKHTLRSSKYKKFDAIMVMGTQMEDDAFLAKNSSKFSNVVLLNRHVEGFPCVCGNDQEGAANLASKIAARNYYDRYLVITHPVMSRLERMRVAGYLEGLKSIDPDRVELIERLQSPADPETSDAFFDSMRGKRTACFEVQYYPGAMLLAQAARRGFSIPDEIGVAAYDRHSIIENILTHELTTVDPRIEEMTKETVLMCFELKNGKKPQSRQILSETIPGNSMVY